MESLCERCSSLDFATISEADARTYFGVNEGYPQGHDLYFFSVRSDLDELDYLNISDLGRMLNLYHKDTKSLVTAAASCQVCKLVLGSVQQVFNAMARAREMDYDYRQVEYEFWICGRDDCSSGFMVLGFEHGDPKPLQNRSYVLMASIDFRVEQVIGRPIPEAPRDPLQIQRLKQWIQNCSENHHHENMEPLPPLPTRVLRINEDASMVFLEASAGDRGEYAALSHCWGSLQPITMTSNNLSEMQNGLSTSDLPQTFQDAVWMTHALGYRRLWIDSLCIKQDDVEDWKRESATMHTVYRNAVIAISATRAANSSEGFLGPRQQPRPVLVPYQLRDESNQQVSTSNVYAFVSPLKHEAFPNTITEFSGEPLSSRGWALQERFLSARVLHFTRTQTWFECEDRMLSEANNLDLYDAVKMGEVGSYSHFPDSYLFKHRWRQLSALYSSRRLTNPGDKLPAMAGMAAHFAWCSKQALAWAHPDLERPLRKPRRYLAGIWLAEDSIGDLCWKRDDRSERGLRPLEYRAPTWSWTSLDGPIKWDFDLHIELAAVKEAHIELQSPEHIFGQVSGGWLSLSAFICKPQRETRDGFKQGSLCIEMEDSLLFLTPNWDAEPYKLPDNGQFARTEAGEADLSAVIMGCFLTHDGSTFSLFVVLIKPVTAKVSSHPQTPAFERVGSGEALGGGGTEALAKLVNTLKVKKDKEELDEILLL
ncbi:hypothetical protein S7711_10184 [Stachybotrys chartarum IBT 7711]|uniref:Heterokaryon incompatibility domain-containing protein n=1 Tax=Stachybotrys chartarum (strain CBS 109288 / IBT 7711) TaxID=1280523 RepID=A0A084B4M8_STACB|nr:hypothetical protein S7711_10184 [Stachybotrys chartarum IBT 7711]